MSKWTPKTVAATVLDKMVRAYVELVPLPDAEEFVRRQVRRAFASGALTGDELIVALQAPSLTPLGRPLPTVIAGVFIAIRYSAQAVVSHEAGDQSSAWDHAADAQYWCGLVAGIRTGLSRSGREHFESWISTVRAGKRWETHAEARAFVMAEWKKSKADYGSKAGFARIFKKRLLDDFELVVQVRTISDDWLKGM